MTRTRSIPKLALAAVFCIAPSLSLRADNTSVTLAVVPSAYLPGFQAIEEAGNVDPTLVAGGIKVALLTTAAGLMIAIPVNIAYNFFVTRIDQLIIDMERGAQRIIRLAWDLDKDGKIEILQKEDTRWPVAELVAARAEKGAVAAPEAPPSAEEES